jgi:HPt (histidine-containing phosphotransfer) domain-containing protein
VIEALRERFLDRLIESARRRLEHARALEEAGDDRSLDGVANELHGLGGEASMLELTEIALMARSCEAAARQRDRDAVRRGLESLRAATEGLKA